MMNVAVENIAYVHAWLDGRGIEYIRTYADTRKEHWHDVDDLSLFVCNSLKFRFAAIKPKINWNDVHWKYNFLAEDENGACYLYHTKPIIASEAARAWEEGVKWQAVIPVCRAAAFNSFCPSLNCDWKDSLVQRPADQDCNILSQADTAKR